MVHVHKEVNVRKCLFFRVTFKCYNDSYVDSTPNTLIYFIIMQKYECMH